MKIAFSSSLIISLLVLVGRSAGGGGAEDEKIPNDELSIIYYPSEDPNVQVVKAVEASSVERADSVSASETSTTVVTSSSPTKSETTDDDVDESAFKITNAIPSMFENVKTVSLANADTQPRWAIGRAALFTHIPIKYRKKICLVAQGLVSPTNADFLGYIFDAHVYEFESPTGETKTSIALQCPTKTYPRVFLRIPTSLQDLKVVIVPREERSSERYIYSLAIASSMIPVDGEDDAETTALRKHSLFNLPAADLTNFCNDALKRFKYGYFMAFMNRGTVGAPAVYSVAIGDTKALYGVIQCPSSPTLYLLFNNSNRDVKITFLNVVQDWIERAVRPKLMDMFPAANLKSTSKP